LISDEQAPPATAPTPTPFPPLVQLPAKRPLQVWRKAQSNIPDAREQRDLLKRGAAALVERERIVPPLGLAELRELATRVVANAGLAPIYVDYTAVLISNEAWRDALAQVPYERRLFLIPKCLRLEEHCPAPFDQFGLLCKDCGLCSVQDLTSEAHRLGYAVLVAEGSALVRAMIETGKIQAIVGVSCLNVLEKCFPHMEAAAIPGMSIPLLQDDCKNTNVDLDQVWDLIHLTSADRTYRLDLDQLKGRVERWFGAAELEELMGPARGPADELAREWLARAGKRWRPYLAACVHMALTHDGSSEEDPELPRDLAKLGLAVECFHKASLVHDDIEDGDEERYGERTLHAEHGVPLALNAGDLLLGEGYRLIGELDAPPATLVAMLSEAARGHVTLARGQGAELAWAAEPRPLSSLEVLAIFREKTAPAFEVALRLGAYFAGAAPEVHAVLSAYSEALGIAYQIADDLEDFRAEKGGDLAALRPSLILAIAHKRAAEGPERALIEALWRRESSPEEHRAELQRILAERGVLQKARELRAAYEQEAVHSLRTLANPTLKGLLRRVIGKIFGNEHLIEGYCSEFEARNAAGRALIGAPAG
jgi:geranylgeranyl pyrophosphate synthase